MTTTEPKLMTWSEFEILENAGTGHHYELHDGEVVLVPPPGPRHYEIQERLVELLRAALPPESYRVGKEFPYRPLAEMQYWVADVAVVTLDAWRKTSQAGVWIPQSPEITVEILSPSNLRSKIEHQRILTLSSGGLQFWVVDPRTWRVTVTTNQGVTQVYSWDDGEDIIALGSGIELGAIFATTE